MGRAKFIFSYRSKFRRVDFEWLDTPILSRCKSSEFVKPTVGDRRNPTIGA